MKFTLISFTEIITPHLEKLTEQLLNFFLKIAFF